MDEYSEKLKTVFDPPALVLENYIAFFSEISLDLTFLKPADQYGRIMQMKKSFWICFNQVS